MAAVSNESVREELLYEAGKVRYIPTPHTITSQLLQVINDQDCSVNELFRIARYDQGLSGKIMGIANSAFYSRGYKILSLQRALQVIGLEALRAILICLTLLQDILGQFRLSPQDLRNLWSHSLAVSCAAKILSDRQMLGDPDEVFTLAVLHDIGKGVFYTQGERYRTLVREAHETGRDLCYLERAAFGVDHQEVGGFIAQKWRFPEELVVVIERHHSRLAAENTLVSLVAVADAFTEHRNVDLGPQGIILDDERESIDREARRVSELLGVAVDVR